MQLEYSKDQCLMYEESYETVQRQNGDFSLRENMRIYWTKISKLKSFKRRAVLVEPTLTCNTSIYKNKQRPYSEHEIGDNLKNSEDASNKILRF